MMKKHFLTLFAIAFCYTVFGQANKFGIPFIRNFEPKEYQGSEQNWAVVQDKRGVMYFGDNAVGVLEYDGNTWNAIKIPNKTIVRSLAIDNNGVVYVGAVGEIGYLTPDIYGKLYYKSLLPLLDTASQKFGDVWKTFCIDNVVYFCTVSYIFQYTSPGKIKVIKLSKESFFSFLINNKIYNSNFNEGLKELDQDSMKLSLNGNLFSNTDFWAILPYNNDYFLVFIKPDKKSNLSAGFYFYNKNTGEIYDHKQFNFSDFLNEKLVNNNFYYGTSSTFNEYIFATLSSGCYISDKKGSIQNILNKKNGLRDETIIYAYNNSDKDNYQPLWLTLNNGISKIETNTSITKFTEESGLRGITIDIIRYKGTLYVATNVGIFYLDFDENQLPLFKEIKNIDDGWSFLKFKIPNGEEKLLVGTKLNICEIKKDKIFPTDNLYHFCYKLGSSKRNPYSVLACLQNGFSIMTFNNSKWNNKNIIERFPDEFRSVAEDEEGNIWLSTYFSGIRRIDTNFKVHSYAKNEGISDTLQNINIFSIKGKTCFATSIGLFKYDKSKDFFVPDSSFGKRYSDGSKGIFRMAEDSSGGIWMVVTDRGSTKDLRTIEHLIPYNNSYSIDTIPFKRLPEGTAIYSIYPDPDYKGIVWFATSDGVYCYNGNIQRNYKQPFNTLIRKVITGEDSVIFYGTYYKIIDSLNREVSLIQPEELKPVLKFKNNKLVFTYSSTFYEEESHTEFSHYLEGLDEGWSKWSKDNKTPYTYIPEGKYKFHVKARNIYGNESKEAIYEFEVLPPWYRTIWAYICYTILAILFVWGIVRIATYRMKQLNIAYGRYLPGAFLKLLEKRRVIDFKLGDMTEKEMTIMFSDIRSYTNLSETMTPSENFRFQVRYLSMIGIELNKNHGFPVQYYGDGIVAMFPGDADSAITAAIDMHKRVEQYSLDRKSKKRREIKIGVGMHTGKIIMGIRGDQWRWEGGIVGDSVNLASRIEGLTKFYGTSTLMSDDTYNKLRNKDKFNIRFLGRVKVKGKDTPVGIYELIDGLSQEEFKLKIDSKKDFDNALATYYAKDFKKALKMFTSIIRNNDSDFAAHHYIDLCRLYDKEGIQDDWDGVEKMDKK